MDSQYPTSQSQFPRVVFMGTPDFAVASLDAIRTAGYPVVGVVTVPDRPTGRGLKMTCSPVKQYALDHQLPLLQSRTQIQKSLCVCQMEMTVLFLVRQQV